MKIEKLHLDGKKESIEVLDKIFAAKINKQLVSNVLYKTNANYKKRKAKPKIKGSLEKVEEMAIQRTMYYLWDKNYWVFREQQGKGPADIYAFKIINGEKKEYF